MLFQWTLPEWGWAGTAACSVGRVPCGMDRCWSGVLASASSVTLQCSLYWCIAPAHTDMTSGAPAGSEQITAVDYSIFLFPLTCYHLALVISVYWMMCHGWWNRSSHVYSEVCKMLLMYRNVDWIELYSTDRQLAKIYCKSNALKKLKNQIILFFILQWLSQTLAPKLHQVCNFIHLFLKTTL